MDLTKTSNLVIFIVLISVGVGTASALSTITLAGDVTITGVTTLLGNLICTNCIHSGDIAAGAVGSSEVIDQSLVANDIAPNAVGSSEIVANAVGTSEIADGQIMTVDIATDAVTGEKIAGTSKLIFGSCTISVPGITPGFSQNHSCTQAGVSNGDKVLVNNRGGIGCLVITFAGVLATDTLTFNFQNGCSNVNSPSTQILQYIVFD